MKTIKFNEPEVLTYLSRGKELSGIIESENGKNIEFSIVKDYNGISFSQSGATDEELFNTFPQMKFFQKPRNFEIFHVYLTNLFLAE